MDIQLSDRIRILQITLIGKPKKGVYKNGGNSVAPPPNLTLEFTALL